MRWWLGSLVGLRDRGVRRCPARAGVLLWVLRTGGYKARCRLLLLIVARLWHRRGAPADAHGRACCRWSSRGGRFLGETQDALMDPGRCRVDLLELLCRWILGEREDRGKKKAHVVENGCDGGVDVESSVAGGELNEGGD